MILGGPKGPFIYIAYMFSLLIRGNHVLGSLTKQSLFVISDMFTAATEGGIGEFVRLTKTNIMRKPW